MHVQKLRVKSSGLIPAGAYFADITAKLEKMNTREATLRTRLDAEDRALEAVYRKRSAARIALSAERHAMM